MYYKDWNVNHKRLWHKTLNLGGSGHGTSSTLLRIGYVCPMGGQHLTACLGLAMNGMPQWPDKYRYGEQGLKYGCRVL